MEQDHLFEHRPLLWHRPRRQVVEKTSCSNSPDSTRLSLLNTRSLQVPAENSRKTAAALAVYAPSSWHGKGTPPHIRGNRRAPRHPVWADRPPAIYPAVPSYPCVQTTYEDDE
jgi:hypothetical protein